MYNLYVFIVEVYESLLFLKTFRTILCLKIDGKQPNCSSSQLTTLFNTT